MVIKKVTAADIINLAYEAQNKMRDTQVEAFNNITVNIGKIIESCFKVGFLMSVSFDELNDYFLMIKRRIKETECVVVISIPKNPPVRVLDAVRVLCDNSSIGSITVIDNTLIQNINIYIIDGRPEHRKMYSVDYATKIIEK